MNLKSPYHPRACYLVSSETTNALVWCTCNMVPTTPWALQLSQESYFEHWENKKKGYEDSTSYHIVTKHKHDTNSLVESLCRGHKSSYQPLFYFSMLHQNNTNKVLNCATQKSQYQRSGNIVWFAKMLVLDGNPQQPNIREVGLSHLRTSFMHNVYPTTPLRMW